MDSERIQYNDDRTVTVLLRVPIEQKQGEPIDELTIRRPKGADMQAAESHKGGVSGSFAIIASISGQKMATIREMDAADIRLISDLLEEMIGGKSRQTGED